MTYNSNYNSTYDEDDVRDIYPPNFIPGSAIFNPISNILTVRMHMVS